MKFFSLFNFSKLRKLNIGAGTHTIIIPSKYDYLYDEEKTLLFYPKGEETITIRVTVISFDTKDDTHNPGKQFTIDKANKENAGYYLLDDETAVFEYSYFSVEKGEKLIMKFWEAGSGNNIIIISGTILEGKKDIQNVDELLSEMPGILKSIKEK